MHPLYEADLKFFVDAMDYKLKKNIHKGKWVNVDLKEALRLLKQEVEELELAIADGNAVEIILEAADCANFALIAASIAVSKGAGNVREGIARFGPCSSVGDSASEPAPIGS